MFIFYADREEEKRDYMDTQFKEPQELDDQQRLAREYALSESARYAGGNRRPPKKGPGFGMGVLIGCACTLLAVTVLLLGGWTIMHSVSSVTEVKEEETSEGTKEAVTDRSVELGSLRI